MRILPSYAEILFFSCLEFDTNWKNYQKINNWIFFRKSSFSGNKPWIIKFLFDLFIFLPTLNLQPCVESKYFPLSPIILSLFKPDAIEERDYFSSILFDLLCRYMSAITFPFIGSAFFHPSLVILLFVKFIINHFWHSFWSLNYIKFVFRWIMKWKKLH